MTVTTLQAHDVSRQKNVRIESQSARSVSTLIDDLVQAMHLPTAGPDGRPITYAARRDRDGKHLFGSARIGDELDQEETITLHANIDAGGRRSALS